MIYTDDIEVMETILVVADRSDSVGLMGALSPYYNIKVAVNASIAVSVAKEQQPDLIMLDVHLSDMSSFDLCAHLLNDEKTSGIPIIMSCDEQSALIEEKCIQFGVVDLIVKENSTAMILNKIGLQLKLKHTENKVLKLSSTCRELSHCLGRAVEYKDDQTGLHSTRISHYAHCLALTATKNEAWSNLLFYASAMHDLGNVSVPDEVLLKTGRLNYNEWEIMKRHVNKGIEILGDYESELLSMAAEVIQSHHEKWDGTGYPRCISGDRIPLSARIVAIVDVFDALTTERPYKKAWSVEKAMIMIGDQADKHFDPELVTYFKEALPRILTIKDAYSINGEISRGG